MGGGGGGGGDGGGGGGSEDGGTALFWNGNEKERVRGRFFDVFPYEFVNSRELHLFKQ